MRNRSSGVAPALLILAGLGFAAIPLARGEIFYYWDNAQQHYPQTVFLADGLRSGSIPHWWPRADGGRGAGGALPAGAPAVEAPRPAGIRVEPHWRNASGALQSLVLGKRHYITSETTMDSEELYDLLADPSELNSLASTVDTRKERQTLEDMLRAGTPES